MNLTLWILQAIAALMYTASGTMKVFMLEKISTDVPSFGALPKKVWIGLGVVELICVVGLILPSALAWMPILTPASATTLAAESLVFIGVHAKYREIGPILFCLGLGVLMAFIAYGRIFLSPIA